MAKGIVARKEPRGAETERRVWDLRKAGAPFPAIARALTMSEAGVKKAYYRALRRHRVSPAEIEEHRALAHARLEDLLVTAWGPAKAGDLAAIDQARKLVLDIAKLMGVVLPNGAVTVNVEQEAQRAVVVDLPAARQAVIGELARVAARELAAGDDPRASGNGHAGH